MQTVRSNIVPVAKSFVTGEGTDGTGTGTGTGVGTGGTGTDVGTGGNTVGMATVVKGVVTENGLAVGFSGVPSNLLR